jgi:glycyl-tRNA synthetase
MENKPELLDKVVSLAKRRGFLYPSSEIYGGLSGFYDYGPLGLNLKENIKRLWWRMFVEERDDILGLDSALIMNPRVWGASGHVVSFTDQKFNLMFKTSVGAAKEAIISYLRPETAQGIFVNFKNIIDSFHPQLPFGIAQIGKAFRNEIAPRDFLFRLREFEQMELEYFVKEDDWEKYFAEWQKIMGQWLAALGLNQEHVHESEVPASERAHYSKRTIDFEFDYPFGRKELCGLAYRGDYDLKRHQEMSGADLTCAGVLPHVIEPSLGVDRLVLAMLLDAYTEDEMNGEKRVVLKLAPALAPIRAAVFPLLKNKPELVTKAREIYSNLKPKTCNLIFDDNDNIGKRYRRQDEIGTPYCLTVDFQTLDDGTVTIRARDSGKQERIKPEEAPQNYADD